MTDRRYDSSLSIFERVTHIAEERRDLLFLIPECRTFILKTSTSEKSHFICNWKGCFSCGISHNVDKCSRVARMHSWWLPRSTIQQTESQSKWWKCFQSQTRSQPWFTTPPWGKRKMLLQSGADIVLVFYRFSQTKFISFHKKLKYVQYYN